MATLVGWFEQAGARAARTYIQSGNVVFSADTPGAVVARVAEAIEAELERPIEIITRTVKDLRQVLADNPFLAPHVDVRQLHVAFLASRPSAVRAARIDGDRSPPDELVVAGRHIYLRFPHGVGKTKLTNDYFERILGTVSTVRNWRTVNALVELTEGF